MKKNKTENKAFSRGEFVLAFRTNLSGGYRCAFHSHDCVEIVFHAKGSGKTTLSNKETFSFDQGSVAVYAPLESHNQTMKTDGVDSCFLLRIGEDGWPFEERAFIIDEVYHPFLLREMEDFESWTSEDKELWKDVLDLRISALFSGLIKEAELRKKSDGVSSSSRHAAQAGKLIETGIDKMRNVTDIAKSLGLSPDYLRHSFRKEYGMTLTEFMIRTRVNRARELLRYSSICLKEVAPLCGFINERQMSVTFKAHTGVSPGEYRR